AVLADIRDPQDTTLLMEALARESSARVRAAMIRALGRVGDVNVLPTLQNALDDASPEVAGEAVLAIGQVCERMKDQATARRAACECVAGRFEKLGAGEQTLIEPFLETMTRLVDPRFGPMFARFMRTGASTSIRQAAIRGAAALGDGTLTDQIAT